jgi:hypothetical protein
VVLSNLHRVRLPRELWAAALLAELGILHYIANTNTHHAICSG